MAIGRALTVLRAIAGAGAPGARAGELASATGLHRVSVHRVLAELAREGLVEQDEARCYHLGPEALFLGQAAGRRFDLARVGEPAIDRIERETHDTVYLLRRVPGAVLCIARRDGTYPIKSLVMDVGGRYPLGIGGGGLAVLAFLRPPDIEAALEGVAKRLDAYPRVTMRKIRQLLVQTKREGYSYWPGLISEAHVVGVPVFGAAGEPVGALSCAAIRERLDDRRRKKVVALLKAEARAIERQLNGARKAGKSNP